MDRLPEPHLVRQDTRVSIVEKVDHPVQTWAEREACHTEEKFLSHTLVYTPLSPVMNAILSSHLQVGKSGVSLSEGS